MGIFCRHWRRRTAENALPKPMCPSDLTGAISYRALSISGVGNLGRLEPTRVTAFLMVRDLRRQAGWAARGAQQILAAPLKTEATWPTPVKKP